jgi:hypothetical protein
MKLNMYTETPLSIKAYVVGATTSPLLDSSYHCVFDVLQFFILFRHALNSRYFIDNNISNEKQ